MNSLVYVSRTPPAPVEPQFRPLEPGGLHFREILGIVLQRAWLAAFVGGAILALTLIYFWQMTPTYAATGSLLIEPRRENLAATERSENGWMPPDTSAIDTQVEMLRSHALAEDVVRRLKLYNDPEFNPQTRAWGRKPAPAIANPSPALVSRVADRLQQRIGVRRVGLTYVVQVSGVSASPRKAALIANTAMDAYLKRQLDDKLSSIGRANRELGSQLEQMRKEAEVAQARVQQYKIAHNLLSAEGATMAEQEVSTLNQQIALARAETAEKQARLAQALAQVRRGGGGADVGAALGSDTIRELRKQEAELSVKLAQLKADFKPGYPEVRRTEAQLGDVRTQIQAEINRILSSLRAEATAAAQRQGSLLGSRGAAQGGLASNNQAQVGLVGLQQKADAAKQIYEAYLNRAKEVAAAGSFQQPDASIASNATEPRQPFSPNMKLALALGLLLGTVGGGGSILAAELWARGLRSRLDVEKELGVPFAGIVPDLQSVGLTGHARHANTADFLVNHPFSSFAEALRNLRAFLLLSTQGTPGKLVALTSAVPREGKSLTTYCLARTLALSGANVVVVDCDLRQRGLTKLVGDREIGIVEVVEKKAGLDEALIQDPKTPLRILPAAPRSSLPYDLFGSAGADELFRELCERFDYVLLDTPPVLGVADARIVAAKADHVLYVVQWNKTPMRAAQAAVDLLQQSGAKVTGALLSQVNIRQQSRYGYGDSSDYFHYYRDYYLTAA